MFTWICPQCGREVPPAYTDCPDCEAKAAKGGAAAEAAPLPQQPPQPGYAAPPPAPPAPQVLVRPYEAGPPAPHGGLPTWLMTIVFALAFLGLGAGLYWVVGYFRGRGTPAPSASVESPAAKPGTKTNPLQKYVEVSGVRFTEEGKKKVLSVKFVVVNHSGADISGLAGNVTVWGRTQKSEEDAAGTFSFQTNLGPFESKELTAPLTTKLKVYELPDWQNVSADIQITAPGN